MSRITPEQIDTLLPQTQCGLCGYGGCMPYAEALAYENANINLCPPGGVKTLLALGELLQQDPTPFISEIEQKAKPASLAIIRESECIGCTKCIQACPVDAIIGTAKQMHTILTSLCTGCELCIPPCPVDCIDLTETNAFDEAKKNLARLQFNAREQRLKCEEVTKYKKEQARSLVEKQAYIEKAIARAHMKRSSRQK